MITLENVSQEWKDFSLHDISFTVEEGEYFVILGPTAAGKTLILETIAGIHVPREGKIFLKGEDITHFPPEKRKIGFVYQDYALFPHMTVEENIAFGLKMQRLPPSEREKEVRDIMKTIGISHLKDRRPATLSGGEQQRVALARALVVNPEVLLLDEPLSALDPRTQESLRTELGRIHQIQGTTTLHVTHDQREALALADRIGIIMEGQVVQVGDPYQVFDHPENEEIARFVGVENVVKGRITSHQDGVAVVDTENYQIQAISRLKEGEVHAFIRPENIVLSLSKLRSSARNTIPGKITGITRVGVTYKIRFDHGLTALVTKQSIEDLGLEEGKKVYTSFKASSIHLTPI
ncbi:MAG: tungstate ABC transporter ATP-binding protein WtpC [Thermoproteota archaeon]